MRICLDTNAYSEFKHGSTMLTRILENADEIHVPSIVLGELYAGFQMGTLTDRNIVELEGFLLTSGIFVTDVTADIALRYGYLIKILKTQGTPIPTNDIWIAASAMETGTILLSRDRHFKNISGLLCMDWPEDK